MKIEAWRDVPAQEKTVQMVARVAVVLAAVSVATRLWVWVENLAATPWGPARMALPPPVHVPLVRESWAVWWAVGVVLIVALIQLRKYVPGVLMALAMIVCLLPQMWGPMSWNLSATPGFSAWLRGDKSPYMWDMLSDVVVALCLGVAALAVWRKR